ncbi:hypothetical protein R0K17_05940 [Planococcus sp. SIMBA_143]
MKVNLNKRQKEILKNLLKLFKPGSFIYPGVLIRELNISMKDAYTLLNSLASENLLREVYEVSCPYENRSTGVVYDNALELLNADTYLSCPTCDQIIDIKENNIAIYKVLKRIDIIYEE